MHQRIEKTKTSFQRTWKYFTNFYSYCYQKDKKLTVAFTIYVMAASIDEARLFFENRGLLWVLYSMFIKLKP
jgi:hypothetical protein